MTAFRDKIYPVGHPLGRSVLRLMLRTAAFVFFAAQFGFATQAMSADLRVAQNIVVQKDVAQKEADELPSVTVGPAPASKGPRIIPRPNTDVDTPQKPNFTAPAKNLQLRLDPKTGQPLTGEQLDARGKSALTQAPVQAPIQAPRQLRAPKTGQAEQTATGNSPLASERTTQSAASGAGIQVKPLGQAKVSAIGLLNRAEGGFGNDMWAGTSLPLVTRLMPGLPVSTVSPVMQSLRRRLLLSVAVPPESVPPQSNGNDAPTDIHADTRTDADADDDGSALAALRIELLAASGDYAAVANLLKFVPRSADKGIYDRVRVEAELLAGNVRQACRMVRNRLGLAGGSGETIWQMIMAFCLALDGQSAQVELYEQLLYENGVEDEAYFTLLAGLNSGEAEPVDNIAHAQPLHLAMLRAARRAIPASTLKNATPVVLRAIATSPNAPRAMRLEAAERAEAMGTLTTDVLRRVYASIPFSAEQNADAVALAERQPGPSAAAILFQVAQIDAQVEGRAKALMAAWRNGRRSGRYMTSVRVNLPMVQAIRADADLAWFAASAGRALLAAGERDAARAWLMAVVEPARAGRVDATAAMLALAPLLYVTANNVPDQELDAIMVKVLTGWWQGEVANSSAERYQRALRLFGLLEALGRDVSEQLWLPLFDAPDREIRQASPSLLLGLARAAADGRRGEVVLLSLLLLGNSGPAMSDSLTLGRVVDALGSVGLVKDAGAVAFEGLLALDF